MKRRWPIVPAVVVLAAMILGVVFVLLAGPQVGTSIN